MATATTVELTKAYKNAVKKLMADGYRRLEAEAIAAVEMEQAGKTK